MPPESPSAKPQYRRRLYVHSIQKKYGRLATIAIFSYLLVVFGLVLISPFLLALFGFLQAESTFAARELIVVGELIWPSFVLLVFAAALFAVFITQRIGGPLHKIEMYARSVARGELAKRMRFRKYDNLDELADALNAATAHVDQAFGVLDAERRRLDQTLEQLRSALAERESEDEESAEQALLQAERCAKGIAKSLAAFQYTDEESKAGG